MPTSLFTALITPFKEHGLDLDGFSENLQDQISAKIKGLLVLGSTGETPALSMDEKEALLKCLFNAVSPDQEVMVGTSSNNTNQAIENTLMAQHYNASSALIITPYYNKPTQRGIYKHFLKISENTSIPIILYNHPGRTGQNIEIETLKSLMKIPNIIGIKDASGDLGYIQQLAFSVASERNDFLIYSGDDFNALAYIALGACGLISVASNLIPRTIYNWLSIMLEHNFIDAQKYHKILFPFLQALNLETNPSPIKAAMNYCGKSAGELRLPLVEMDKENKLTLQNIINNTALIHGETQPQYHKAPV
ncbi:MAG: 4-hydroxy-tetrahydrodipicolinate synthase [Chlamydiae bacterium]|nr:4-hydroxy-tetrahydrodipicolinate synthase [Chlamydiota bacterium]